jgi:simple sugar transport system ATP-binding protein
LVEHAPSDYVALMSGICKDFGEVHAVKDGFFALREGEIHSLIGENGAGKSTLMNILYGMHNADAGDIFLKGEKVGRHSPKKAISFGLGMVHQEFALVNELTVLENIILGFEPVKRGVIDFARAEKQIQKYSDTYGLEVHPDKRILDISVGEAQKVEILKTLYRGANILILDEPTAVLTPQETVGLFNILRILKKQGLSVIFISHKLNEVKEISDRITVMRDGEYITTMESKDADIHDLARLMVGRDITLAERSPGTKRGEIILSVKNIFVSSKKELSKIKDVSFDLHKGEVLGVAGVDGNGQSELVEALTGLRKTESGSIYIKGQQIQNKDVLAIRNTGLAFIPDDRNKRGLNRAFSIVENLIANRVCARSISKHGIIMKKRADDIADNAMDTYDIRPGNPSLLVGNLSGGNAQKVVFAREIESDFDILIAAQPTRGIDVGSIENIHKLIHRIKSEGKSILLVSAELEEIFALSDRIMVLYEGHVVDIVDAHETDHEKIGLMMTGGSVA